MGMLSLLQSREMEMGRPQLQLSRQLALWESSLRHQSKRGEFCMGSVCVRVLVSSQRAVKRWNS
jgi:hypothetical protein